MCSSLKDSELQIETPGQGIHSLTSIRHTLVNPTHSFILTCTSHLPPTSASGVHSSGCAGSEGPRTAKLIFGIMGLVDQSFMWLCMKLASQDATIDVCQCAGWHVISVDAGMRSSWYCMMEDECHSLGLAPGKAVGQAERGC